MAKPTLEGLPTELLILILLQIQDRPTLKSIILSSPICHHAYLTAREEVLSSILKVMYGGLLKEAIAATRSRGLYFFHRKEEAIALLDTWRRNEEIHELNLGISKPIDEPDGLEEILNLFQFHNIIHFFLHDFKTKAPRPAWIDQGPHADFKFNSNIFGMPEHPPVYDWSQIIHNDWMLKKRNLAPFCSIQEETYRLFFGAMPFWQYEEMGCVYAYFQTKFPPFTPEIRESLCKLVMDYEIDHSPLMSGAFEWLPEDIRPPCLYIQSVSDVELIDDRAHVLAGVGPDFIYRVIHADPLLRRNMIIMNASSANDPWIGIWLGHIADNPEVSAPMTYPAEQILSQTPEQLWATLPPLELPNLGYKLSRIVPEHPDDVLQDFVDLGSSELHWDWCYAIWDDDRLREFDAIGVLLQ